MHSKQGQHHRFALANPFAVQRGQMHPGLCKQCKGIPSDLRAERTESIFIHKDDCWLYAASHSKQGLHHLLPLSYLLAGSGTVQHVEALQAE